MYMLYATVQVITQGPTINLLARLILNNLKYETEESYYIA